MNRRIVTGLLAAVAAVLLPLLICGMGKRMATETAAPQEAEQLWHEARTVREIVIHQSIAAGQLPKDDTDWISVCVDGTLEKMTLLDYLTGVLMGEMPAFFELEALKAQAVAARTYTLRRIEEGSTLSDDPAVCQAFIPLSRSEETLGENWEELLKKLRTAVRDTDHQVLTYDGALISATYFSSAVGRTESAQAVWGGERPYLVSVESPETGSQYESEVTLSVEECKEILEITDLGVSDVTYTEGGGVAALTIGGKTFSGTELRQLFGLKSTCFSMEITADTVTFQVKGSGHRVGMSQYGAQTMAQEGKTYEEILSWYYTGVTLCDYDK